MAEDTEPTDPEDEFTAALRRIVPYADALTEKWLELPRETRAELVQIGQAFIALVSAVSLESISASSKSMAKSSREITRLTKYLIALTVALTAETGVMLYFIFIFH